MSGTAVSITPDLHELIRRVALFQHGLGFLHQAEVDCIAVTLGVHPFVVVEARRLLDVPEGRARLIEALRLAREEGSGQGDGLAAGDGGARAADRGASRAGGARGSDGQPARAIGLRGLLRAARRHPLGLPFLMQAPFETVAVTFRVHPFLVLQARTLLARREERRRNSGLSEGNQRG